MTDVLILGAGAAGLAAAEELSRNGAQVEILEARNRTGGRVWTVPSLDKFVPSELGAEFIHGTDEAMWDLIRKAGCGVRKVADQHWTYPPLVKQTDFWSSLEDCIASIGQHGEDTSFDDHLRQHPCHHEWLVRLFVEGFDAADTQKISSHSLAKASEEEGQDKAAWLEGGYARLTNWLAQRAIEQGAIIHFNTRVDAIRWRAHQVELVAGERTWRASQVIITLPLGVLKANTVSFEPALPFEIQRAIDGMEMGHIVKIIFEFDRAFWKSRLGSKNFGFIHSQTGPLRTWWSRELAPIVIGWVGGPDAQQMDNHPAIANVALQQLSQFANVPLAKIKSALKQWRSHDWSRDPFTQGAYSYVGVNNIDAPNRLAEPVDNTLFFAGEATADLADLGTVHGALASGRRAAQLIETSRLPSFA